MGSSGGSANPMYLSQGGVPMPGLPIAGQGAPNDNPRSFGSFQSFLPDAPAAGTGPAPSARGITAEMLQYRSPPGNTIPSDVDSLRQQLASLQAQQAGNGQFGAARGGSGGGGQQPGFGMYGQQSAIGFPQNWTNSNVPNATS